MFDHSAFKLTRQRFNNSAHYIKTFGRNIDIALFDHYFNDMPRRIVLDTLGQYSNIDGGFGRGLELDFLYSGSTPISTVKGLEILHSLHMVGNSDLIYKALEYLQSTINSRNYWSSINENVNSRPRAVWWNYPSECDVMFKLNPTAEIAGCFYYFGGGTYRSFSYELLDMCADYLSDVNSGNDMRELMSLMQLIRILPNSTGMRFARLLRPRLNETLITDTKKYHEHVLSPLSIFKAPYDPLYEYFKEPVQRHLDHILRTQHDDGFWEVNWDWEQYENDFNSVLPILRANVTLKNLLMLKAFERI